MLAEVRAGAAPTDETRKLWLIVRALALRARRPDAFAGDYVPLPAGRDACAFVREDAVLAAAVVRGDGAGVELELPPGRWRDVLGDEEHGGGRAELAELAGEHGIV